MRARPRSAASPARGCCGDTQRVRLIDFLVDVLASGAVLGVGVSGSPEDVTRRLGEDFTETRRRGQLYRDYGLAEFFWERPPGGDEWHPAGFALQVHRLAHAAALPLPGRPGIVLGPGEHRVRFGDVSSGLARIGYRLEEITEGHDQPDWRRFWIAETEVSVTVAAAPAAGLEDGDVYAVHAPCRAQSVAATAMSVRRQSVRDGLEHLRRLPGDEREAWLDRRQPPAQDRVNWWLYLLLVIDARIRDRPGPDSGWAGLRLWLLDRGRARGVFDAVRYAEDLAYFTLRMRRSGSASAYLPSPDDIVRACLSAIPVTMEQAAVRDDEGNLTIRDRSRLLRSREAKRLISAAHWHLDAVAGHELVSQVRQWEEAKSYLA